jgi:hypothetical protein
MMEYFNKFYNWLTNILTINPHLDAGTIGCSVKLLKASLHLKDDQH